MELKKMIPSKSASLEEAFCEDDAPSKLLNMKSKISSSNLELYKQQLLKAATESSMVIFNNKDQDHARVAFSVLFSQTNYSVKIIADNFNGDISNNDDYTRELKACLERNVKAEVMILDDVHPTSVGFEILRGRMISHPHQVQIKVATKDSENEIRKNMRRGLLDFGHLHNFSIFDTQKYRIEYIPKQYTALLSFNGIDVASEYSKAFDLAFKVGRNYTS